MGADASRSRTGARTAWGSVRTIGWRTAMRQSPESSPPRMRAGQAVNGPWCWCDDSGVGKVNSPCRKGGHGVPEWWTRCAGMVDTRRLRGGGHPGDNPSNHVLRVAADEPQQSGTPGAHAVQAKEVAARHL